MEKFRVLVGKSRLNQLLLIIFVFLWLHTCNRHSLKHFSRLFMYTANFISLECLEGISSTIAQTSTFKDELIRFWRSVSRTLFCAPQSKNSSQLNTWKTIVSAVIVLFSFHSCRSVIPTECRSAYKYVWHKEWRNQKSWGINVETGVCFCTVNFQKEQTIMKRKRKT